MKISNGKWNWFSRKIGGKTALDYLIKVQGFSFTQAVEALADWEIRLRRMAVETDYTPHTVYTLMDGDRMRCLYRDLREEETDENG